MVRGVTDIGNANNNKSTDKELTMSKQVIIDTDECIGCQSCVEICPDVFGFNDDDNKAFVINPDGGSIECADEAAASCPAECIHIK